MKKNKLMNFKKIIAFLLAFNHLSLMASPLLFGIRIFPKRHRSEAPKVNPVTNEAPADDQQLEQLKAENVWLEEVLHPLLVEVLKRHSTIESFVEEINEWGPVEDFKHSESVFEIRTRASEMLKDLEQLQLYLYLAQLNLLHRNEIFKDQKNKIYESISRFDTFYYLLENQLNNILRESDKLAKHKADLQLDLKIQDFMDQMNHEFRNCDLVYRPSNIESYYQCADFSYGSISRDRARESSKSSSDSKGGGSSSGSKSGGASSGSGGKSSGASAGSGGSVSTAGNKSPGTGGAKASASGSRASESKSTPAKSESKAVRESVKVTGSAGNVRVEVTRVDARGNVTEIKSIETNDPKSIDRIRSSVGVKSSSTNFEKTVSREIGYVELKGPEGKVSRLEKETPTHVDGGKSSEKTIVASNSRDKTNEKHQSEHPEVRSVDCKSREPISVRIGRDFPRESPSSTSSRGDFAQKTKTDPKSQYELKFSDYTDFILNELSLGIKNSLSSTFVDSLALANQDNVRNVISKLKKTLDSLRTGLSALNNIDRAQIERGLFVAEDYMDHASNALEAQIVEVAVGFANASLQIVANYGPMAVKVGVAISPAGKVVNLVELGSGKDVLTGEDIGASGRALAAFCLLLGNRQFWNSASQFVSKEAKAAFSAEGAFTKDIVSIEEFNPITKEGPLLRDAANTFRSATYSKMVRSVPTKLYRVVSKDGNPRGSFWMLNYPVGPTGEIIDKALFHEFKNNALAIYSAEVPAGKEMFVGKVAPQAGMVGGGVQVYIHESVVEGLEILKVK